MPSTCSKCLRLKLARRLSPLYVLRPTCRLLKQALPNLLVNDFHVLQGGIEFIRLLVCPKSYEMVE